MKARKFAASLSYRAAIPTAMPDAIEESLHVIAVPIEMRAEADWVFAISFRRDVWPGTKLSSKLPDCIKVVRSVGRQQPVVTRFCQQISCE